MTIQAGFNPTQNKITTSGFILLGLIGVGVILATTRWGAGLTDDSYFYVSPAKDVLAGKPFLMDSSWQPLLPLVLIVIGKLGIDLLAGIRVLHAVLFGGSVILVGLTIKKATSSSIFALVGAGLFLLSADFIDVHSWLMSEALYFFCMLLGLFGMVSYLKEHRLSWLVLAAVGASLAALARFIGATVVFAGAVGIMVSAQPFRRRVRDITLFVAVSALPTGLYLLRNLLTTGIISHRLPFVWGPFGVEAYTKTLYNILLWFMPGRLAKGREFLALGALLAAAIVVMAAYAIMHHKNARIYNSQLAVDPVLILLGSLFLSNLAVLYYSWGYSVESDMRKLSPAHLALLLILVILIARFWQVGGRVTQLALAVFLVVFIGFHASRAVDTVRTFYQQGAGYANRYWAASEASTFASQHASTQMVSTAPYGLYFKTGFLVRHVVDFNTPQSIQNFLRQTSGYLIVFEGMPLQIYGINPDDYTRGLVKVASFNDAVVYQAQP